jgi:carbon storage regulator
VLIITRRLNERIRINKDITIQLLDLRPGSARLGITAPRDIPVDREEIYKKKLAKPLFPQKTQGD